MWQAEQKQTRGQQIRSPRGGPDGRTLAEDSSWKISDSHLSPDPQVWSLSSPSHITKGIGETMRSTPTTKAGCVSLITTVCNYGLKAVSNMLSKPCSVTHVEEEWVCGVKSMQVHDTGIQTHPGRVREGVLGVTPRAQHQSSSKGSWQLRFLCMQNNNNKKAFIMLAFLKLRNI